MSFALPKIFVRVHQHRLNDLHRRYGSPFTIIPESLELVTDFVPLGTSINIPDFVPLGTSTNILFAEFVRIVAKKWLQNGEWIDTEFRAFDLHSITIAKNWAYAYERQQQAWVYGPDVAPVRQLTSFDGDWAEVLNDENLRKLFR